MGMGFVIADALRSARCASVNPDHAACGNLWTGTCRDCIRWKPCYIHHCASVIIASSQAKVHNKSCHAESFVQQPSLAATLNAWQKLSAHPGHTATRTQLQRNSRACTFRRRHETRSTRFYQNRRHQRKTSSSCRRYVLMPSSSSWG